MLNKDGTDCKRRAVLDNVCMMHFKLRMKLLGFVNEERMHGREKGGKAHIK